MQFLDILDKTFSLYRSSFRLYIGITAILYIPLSALKALLLPEIFIPGRLLLAQGRFFFLMMVESLLIYPIAIGTLIFVTSQKYLGQQTTIEEALRHVKFLSILSVYLVWILGVLLMWITCIGIPFSIYFLFAWSLCCQSIMLEDHTVIGALSRSRQLIKRMWWRVFGIQILLFILTLIFMFLPLFTLGMLIGIFNLDIPSTTTLISYIIESILRIIAIPIPLIGATLLYFDLRIRKEAFDIEMMATNLNSEPPQP